MKCADDFNFNLKSNSGAGASNIWDSFNQFDDLNNNDNDGKKIEEEIKLEELEEYDELQELYGCEFCRTFTLVYRDGQCSCSTCGRVQKTKLSQEAEYRYYGDNDNKSSNPERVGMPTNYMLPQSSNGSLIAYRSYDNQYIKRMVQYNSWHQMPYKERAKYKTFCKIANIGKLHGIPNMIIERSKEFYNTIKHVNKSRGDNHNGLVAACLYFACRDEKVPRSAKEIAKMFKIKMQDMTIGQKTFRDNFHQAKITTDVFKVECTTPIDFIDRYCSQLSINNNIGGPKHIAEFIAIKAIVNNLVNDNTAPSIAAGSIFLACAITNQNVTKKQVAIACKTSEVTISKCYKKLNDHKLDLLPKSIISKYIK